MELARLAVAEAGRGEIVSVPWPEEYRAIETGNFQSAIELARQELNWSPSTSLREGVARTVAYYREQFGV